MKKTVCLVLCLLCFVGGVFALAACTNFDSPELTNPTAATYVVQNPVDASAPTTGNVNSEHNVATSKNDLNNASTSYSDSSYVEGDFYYYLYYLGAISKVPLQQNPEAEYWANLGQSQTVVFTTGKTSTTSISNSISNAVENSVTYKSATGETLGETNSVGGSLSTSCNIFGSSLEAKIEVGVETSFQYSTSKEQSSSEKHTSEKTYEKAITDTTTVQKSVSITLSEKCKNGYYRYTSLGNFQVFGVVVYDTKTKKFACYSDAILESWYWTLDYSETPTFDNDTPKKIVFDVPELDIEKLGVPTKVVEKTETPEVVQPKNITLTLDANGGSVSPSKITGVASSNITLPHPERTDFAFVGWEDPVTGKVVNYTTMPGTSRTLKAKWARTKFYFSKSDESAVHFKGIAGRAEVTLFESWDCDFNYQELLNLGYAKFTIKINFQMRDTNGCDDRLKFSIGNLYLERVTNVKKGQNWNSIEVEFGDNELVYLDTNHIKLWLYGYRGDAGYTWLAGQHINIVVTATK